MPRAGTLPFQISRSDDVIAGGTVTTTTETVDGLLRLYETHLVVQWRLARTVNTIGSVIREDTELEAVREVTVPISALASAVIRASWWPWSKAARLILTAADLRSFESISGANGLRLEHPAQLILDIRKADRATALEFAADIENAMADEAMRTSAALERNRSLPLEGTRHRQIQATSDGSRADVTTDPSEG